MKKSICMYDVTMTYIYSTPDVPKYPFSKCGVPVPVPIPKFPGNLVNTILPSFIHIF